MLLAPKHKLQRADIVLVQRGYVSSREKARRLIDAHSVTCDGHLISKASQPVDIHSHFHIDYAVLRWVSRGGLKLQAAFAQMNVPSCQGAVCIDLGASTGGFSDVLLAKGVKRIYAVDVGDGQLDKKLSADSRLIPLNKTHASTLTSELIPDNIDMVVCDLSFISITKAIAPALNLVRPGGWLIALVKPQFEVGRDKIAKNGIVKDVAAQQEAIRYVSQYLRDTCHWHVKQIITSPITKPDGNTEYFVSAQKPIHPE